MSTEFIATIALILGGVNFILVCFCLFLIDLLTIATREHFDSHLDELKESEN